MTGTCIYTAKRIFTGQEWLDDHAVKTGEGRILQLIPLRELGSAPVDHLGDFILAPAFIDIQIYGAGGKLFSVFPDTRALQTLVEHNLEGGTSLCLPTMATNEIAVFRSGIDAIRDFWHGGGKGIYGIHLEGPWINPHRKGAHLEKFIHRPALQEVKELLEYGKDVIKMITLAPEQCRDEVINYILEKGIKIAAGHSHAVYSEAIHGFDLGIKLVTHLFNAMSPLHHRDPGLAGAAMDDERVMASIIPDGIHVDFAALRIAKKAMGERLFVITDAVTETSRGAYPHKYAGDKYEADGILSGSALTMSQALLNLVQKAGIELGEALRMCSLYPARAVGIDNYRGRIKEGYAGEMVLLNNSGEFIKLIN